VLREVRARRFLDRKWNSGRLVSDSRLAAKRLALASDCLSTETGSPRRDDDLRSHAGTLRGTQYGGAERAATGSGGRRSGGDVTAAAIT